MVTIPNKITIARMCLVPVFVAAFYLPAGNARLIAAALFLIIALTDMLDGYLARKLKQETRTGAVLDPLADKLLVMSALVMMAGKEVPHLVTVIILFREILITGLRTLKQAEHIVQASSLGKWKARAQVLAVLMAMLSLPYNQAMLWTATAITVISGMDYVRRII